MFWNFSGPLFAALVVIGAGFCSYEASPEEHAKLDAYRRPASIPYPEDNPFSEAKAELGRALFFDPILSGPKSISCGTCHKPSLSWGDGLPLAVGMKAMTIRTPTLLNVAWVPILGWDGKFPDLESVAFGPILSPANMDLNETAVIARLGAVPGYVDAFRRAFGQGSITKRKIELALATYERSIVSPDAPFDRWADGDDAALGAAAKRGFAVFNDKGRCNQCHEGWAFNDGSFHDIGSAHGDDVGRGRYFPTSVKLRYAFKTPTLRDVARRAPYMHDGSVPTLADVIALYNRGGIDRPSRSELIRPLGLTGDERSDLETFLLSLTGQPGPATTSPLTR